MRLKQIDKVCYMKWKSAKRSNYVMPWWWLAKVKRTLRKETKCLSRYTIIQTIH